MLLITSGVRARLLVGSQQYVQKGCVDAVLSPLSEHANGAFVQPGIVHAGDVVHLLHVVPEPSMIHVWPGMYVPPDDNAEQEEVNHIQYRTVRLTDGVNEAYILVYMC